MRLAFRVVPGAVGQLEVQAAQRVLPVNPEASAPVDLELAPSVTSAARRRSSSAGVVAARRLMPAAGQLPAPAVLE